MNFAQAKNKVGDGMRLRPLPHRRWRDGTRLPPLDDTWRLEEVLAKPNRLLLVNTSTGHRVELQHDNLHEYRSPHFLMLRCQLTLTERTVEIEPLIQSSQPRMMPGERGPTTTFGQHVALMAAEDPHALILGWWRRLEAVLQDYARARGVHRPLFAAGYEAIISRDPRLGPAVARSLRALRVRRNYVAHRVFEPVSALDATAYATAAFRILGLISRFV